MATERPQQSSWSSVPEEFMEFQDRQFLGLRKRAIAVVVVAALASVMLASAGPAQAKRISGTSGADRIVGTAKADVIKARGGKDRINGRGGNDRLYGGSGRDRLVGGRGKDRLHGGSGRDRLLGGRGADHLNSVDGRRDRLIGGGLGNDICRVDPADEANVRGCEIVTIVTPGAPGGPGGPLVCAAPPEDAALARVPLDDGPPLTFSDAFYAITTTITASADGLTGEDLPISIEDVCDVPQSLATEAAQLVGGGGVALITPATAVFDATGQQLTGDAATTAVSGADTVVIRARLLSPGDWRQDEDGEPVPTFSTSRVDIPD